MLGAGYLLEMLRNQEQNSENVKRKRTKKSNDQRSTKSDSSIKSIDNSADALPNIDQPLSAIDKRSSPEKEESSTIILETEQSSIEKIETASTNFRIDYDFGVSPRSLLKELAAFTPTIGDRNGNRFANNFLKGCKWSPDGSCLLTNSEDRRLRVFTLPDSYYEAKFIPDQKSISDEEMIDGEQKLKLLSTMASGDLIYDYGWYPVMNSAAAESCVYAQASRDHPVQLCDAVSGRLCATYSPINHLDEVTCAYSLAFNADGSRLFAGFNKAIRIFDTYRPGRQLFTKPTWQKRQGGQSGIISCIAVCPTMPSLFACGSYARTVATYSDSADGGPLSVMQAENMGGITHLLYHPNGNYLYSGGRMDTKIVSWDMRMPGRIFAAYERDAATNQRFYFDLDRSGRYLISGGCKGEVQIWDTTKSANSDGYADAISKFRAHLAASNGVSLNPYLPLLATSGGQRLFPKPLPEASEARNTESSDTDDDNDSSVDSSRLDNSLKLWLIKTGFGS